MKVSNQPSNSSPTYTCGWRTGIASTVLAFAVGLQPPAFSRLYCLTSSAEASPDLLIALRHELSSMWR